MARFFGKTCTIGKVFRGPSDLDRLRVATDQPARAGVQLAILPKTASQDSTADENLRPIGR